LRIVHQTQQGGVKFRHRVVLPHHPSCRETQLIHIARRKLHDLGVPFLGGLAHARVTAENAVGDLGKRMLCFARMSAVGKILFNLFVGERTAKPGRFPEQEWHQYKQESSGEDEKQPSPGHALRRYAGILRRGMRIGGSGQIIPGPARQKRGAA